ncbi:MAG: carboxypeptidase-like regulatory domain-containing protein [Nannocystaceae bacterium]|nr:carboxypeptidase-like regulatory domain-containing protein [Nannocystaceae bacterium]
MMGLIAPGCGDDGDPGSAGGSTGEAGTTTSGGSSSGTTDPAPSTSSSTTDGPESSSSSETGVADSSSTGSLPNEVSLGGTVTDFLGILGIEGLTVTMDIDDTSSATTDASGAFTFEDLAPDTAINIIIEPQPDGKPPYAGSIVPERTGTQDRDDVDATSVQGPFIEAQLDGLESQDPEPTDLDLAIVIIRVNPAAIESGTVTLTIDPPPPAGTFYAPNENGGPVLNSTEIGFATLPAAVLFNVADTEAGDIEITAEHSGALTCSVRHPHWFARGGYITQVAVDCE